MKLVGALARHGRARNAAFDHFNSLCYSHLPGDPPFVKGSPAWNVEAERIDAELRKAELQVANAVPLWARCRFTAWVLSRLLW